MKNENKFEFIQHGSFILRLSEISHMVKNDSKNETGEMEYKIIIFMKKDSNASHQSFIMTYACSFTRDEHFSMLTLDCDAITLDYNWKHPLVKQIFIIRDFIAELTEEMHCIKKEMNLFRKQFKKSGIKLEKY